MNVKEIQRLMEAFQKNGLTELELADETFNLKMRREIVAGSATILSSPATGQIPVPSLIVADAESGEGKDGEDALQEDLVTVESPIIGTFYRSSNPEADPYIAVGDVIRKGQVLCIIEAMKIMNEIESEIEGTVVRIFPKNAKAVEYGQRLFAVKPV